MTIVVRMIRNIKIHCTEGRGEGTALQAEKSWVRLPMVLLEVFIDITFPAALWPWGRLSP